MILLYADEKPAARQLLRAALREAGVSCELHFSQDGEELIHYLQQKNSPHWRETPRPDLILVDLNLPTKDGLEALAEIKGDPDLRQIPAVVLTSSQQEADIFSTFGYDATAFLKKPDSFAAFVDLMKVFCKWWRETAELPSDSDGYFRRGKRLVETLGG